jgi:hypothetical protein
VLVFCLQDFCGGKALKEGVILSFSSEVLMDSLIIVTTLPITWWVIQGFRTEVLLDSIAKCLFATL